MRILFPLVLSFASLLNYIELSLAFECLPNGAPIPGVPRTGTSYSPGRNRSISPARHHPVGSPSAELDPAGFHHAGLLPVEYDPAWFSPSEFDPVRFQPDEFPVEGFLYARPSSPDKPFLPTPHSPDKRIVSSAKRIVPPAKDIVPPAKRIVPPAKGIAPPAKGIVTPIRHIAPPTRLPGYHKSGFGLKHLKFIRLISRTNSRLIFELRGYTFPVDAPIKLRFKRDTYSHMPTQEQIVISTADGDIFAILESMNSLAGMYTDGKRAKINMESGKVTLMTKDEIDETPVGRKRPIKKYFRVKRLNDV